MDEDKDPEKISVTGVAGLEVVPETRAAEIEFLRGDTRPLVLELPLDMVGWLMAALDGAQLAAKGKGLTWDQRPIRVSRAEVGLTDQNNIVLTFEMPTKATFSFSLSQPMLHQLSSRLNNILVMSGTQAPPGKPQ